MIDKFKTIILSIFVFSSLLAQNSQWEYHFVGNNVSAICTVGETIYAGTSGGLFIINSETHESEFVNETNSDFKGYEVTSIAEGVNNELWVTVKWEGLNHFDGEKWHNYNTSNSNLSSDYLSSVVVDADNNVWLQKTNWDQNLIKFDGNSFDEFEKITYIRHMAIDALNNLWIISGEKLGYLINDELNVTRDYSDSNYSKAPREILFDSKNDLFLRKERSIEYFNGNDWTEFNISVDDMCKNSIGEVFICENDYGIKKVLKFDENEWSNFVVYNAPKLNNAYEVGDIYKIEFNSNDELIAGITTSYYNNVNDNPVLAYTTGLSVLRNEKWIGLNISNTNIIPYTYFEVVKNIEFDKNNTAYISTTKNGLVKYDGYNWYQYNTYNSNPFIESVALLPSIDSEGKLWLIGTFGLSTLVENEFVHFGTHNTCIPTNSDINRFLIDDHDNKWLASKYDGLIKYNNICEQYFIPIDTNISDSPTQIDNIWIDNENNIWVVGEKWYSDYTLEQNLFKFNGSSFEKYDSDNSGLIYDYVQDMVFGKDGSMYVSTRPNLDGWVGCNGKLVKYKDGIWSEFSEDSNGKDISHVIPLAIDSSGNMWGKDCDGVYKFDGESWTFFNALNSKLPSDRVSHIEVDNYNNIWFTTINGFIVYNESGIVHVKDQTSQYKPNNFTLNQNYPNPFNPSTFISYSISKTSKVILKVYDILGREMNILVNETQSSGNYEIEFNGNDLSSGIYFYRLQFGESFITNKMLLIK